MGTGTALRTEVDRLKRAYRFRELELDLQDLLREPDLAEYMLANLEPLELYRWSPHPDDVSRVDLHRQATRRSCNEVPPGAGPLEDRDCGPHPERMAVHSFVHAGHLPRRIPRGGGRVAAPPRGLGAARDVVRGTAAATGVSPARRTVDPSLTNAMRDRLSPPSTGRHGILPRPSGSSDSASWGRCVIGRRG